MLSISVVRSSVMRRTSAEAIATSLPRMTAIPTSAAVMHAASFTPSPIMHTMRRWGGRLAEEEEEETSEEEVEEDDNDGAPDCKARTRFTLSAGISSPIA